MLHFAEILLAIDLADPLLPAVQQAATLARGFHSEIIMVHVVEPPLHLGAGPAEDKALWSARLAAREKTLDNSVHAELEGIRVKRVVLEGEPAAAIAHAAQHERANLIVVGSHGNAGVDYSLVGSVTAKLLRDAECPVWTVPHPDKFAARLEFRNVLCAMGLAPDPQRIRAAHEFASKFGARFILAHITPDVQTYQPGGHYDVHGMGKQLADVATAKIAELKQQLGIEAEVYIANGDVAPALDEAATSTHADVMIIGRRPRPGWIGGSTYPIVSRSRIPVLSI